MTTKYSYQALADDFFNIHDKRRQRDSLAHCGALQADTERGRGGSMGRRRATGGDASCFQKLPEAIEKTQPPGMEWVIERRGISEYAFRLRFVDRVVPNPQLVSILIPDATPELVSAYALSDEQALLAKVRYNRLVDIFLGVAAYSLQNHLRTTVAGLGQVEIDEIYVGIDKRGRQYVLPVQAKGGNDRLSTVQTRQDIACCAEKFPQLLCRAISAQFVDADLIALFELGISGEDVRIVEERHYRLVPADQITRDDLRAYDT